MQNSLLRHFLRPLGSLGSICRKSWLVTLMSEDINSTLSLTKGVEIQSEIKIPQRLVTNLGAEVATSLWERKGISLKF